MQTGRKVSLGSVDLLFGVVPKHRGGEYHHSTMISVEGWQVNVDEWEIHGKRNVVMCGPGNQGLVLPGVGESNHVYQGGQ